MSRHLAMVRGRTAMSLSLAWSLGSSPAYTQALVGGLRVQVVEGQGAINNVTRGTAFEPVITVQDEQGRPVADASVTFNLPSVGPSATFPDGARTLLTRTDENGRAAARGLRPNRLPGPFDIRVTVSKDGKSASVTVSQTNAAPAASQHAGGNRKWLIVLGLIGGAAAAGVAAASGSKGTSGTAVAAAASAEAPAGTVTPGVPGFGPPR